MTTVEEKQQLLPTSGERKQADVGEREALCRKLANLVKARLRDAFAEYGTTKPGLEADTILKVNPIETRVRDLEGKGYDITVLTDPAKVAVWRKKHEEETAEAGPSSSSVGSQQKKKQKMFHTGAPSVSGKAPATS